MTGFQFEKLLLLLNDDHWRVSVNAGRKAMIYVMFFGDFFY